MILKARKIVEVRLGDIWLKMEENMLDSFVGAIVAEEREKRIWRPLETVIGTKEFLCVE